MSLKSKGLQSSQGSQEQRKTRIILTGEDKKTMNAACEIIRDLGDHHKMQLRGPIMLPIKNLSITTRKTPCGEGSKTWDRFDMKLRKRFFLLDGTDDDIKKIANLKTPPGTSVTLIQLSD